MYLHGDPTIAPATISPTTIGLELGLGLGLGLRLTFRVYHWSNCRRSKCRTFTCTDLFLTETGLEPLWFALPPHAYAVDGKTRQRDGDADPAVDRAAVERHADHEETTDGKHNRDGDGYLWERGRRKDG